MTECMSGNSLPEHSNFNIEEFIVSLFLVALIIGCVAGLRVFVAPAAIAWLAYKSGLDVSGTWASFMSSPFAAGIFTILLLVELVTDQLPSTPSRKVPNQFIPRIVSGAFCAAVLGTYHDAIVASVVLGLIGVAVGTFGGYEFRARIAKAFNGDDHPAAFVEDGLALGLAVIVAMIV
jgi:uncharacterized membrane protein